MSVSTKVATGWEVSKTTGLAGTGNWARFDVTMDIVEAATAKWHEQVDGIAKPWLCWNMNNEWCLLQQKLVSEVGWTPIVGWDPNCGVGKPELVEGAVAIDFNEILNFPALFNHVPLELVFLWTDTLAFWHADLLLPRHKMEKAALIFDRLANGEMAAVKSYGGLRNFFKFSHHRYWELLGCTTALASEDQFNNGCGWWRNFSSHVNVKKGSEEYLLREKYYNDHGVGIRFWEKYYKGKVISISERWVKEGHFSVIGTKNYIRGANKSEEMILNFDLEDIARRFGIQDLL